MKDPAPEETSLPPLPMRMILPHGSRIEKLTSDPVAENLNAILLASLIEANSNTLEPEPILKLVGPNEG